MINRNTEIFHINERILTLNGFSKHVWGDKNSPKDTFNTFKFEEYTKEIKEEIKLEVCYAYITADEKEYRLHSSSISLFINDESSELPIKDLGDFLILIRILKGEDNE